MSLLQKLTPINLLEEKKKFFADETYNPQFLYEEEDERDETTLHKYGKPEKRFEELAQEILARAYRGRNEADLFMMEGPRLTQAQADEKIHHFLKMHHLENDMNVVWSSSFVSRASVNATTLKLRLPPDFHKEGLIGMLYHEIGTHALRRINYEQQPWYKKKKKFGFSDYLETEEGLAVLNALVPHSYKSLYIGAIRYLAVTHSQEHSFAEVWKYLKRWVQNDERRWNITLRAKRGMTDTSKPGFFSKDMVYLTGPVKVWKWLHDHDFDPSLLYFGKLALQDVPKAVEMNPNYKPVLPSFYVLDKTKYQIALQLIGDENQLGKI